jgi:hypothetical protein
VGFLPDRLPPGDPGRGGDGEAGHIYLEQRFSDHAPVMIDYDFKL